MNTSPSLMTRKLLIALTLMWASLGSADTQAQSDSTASSGMDLVAWEIEATQDWTSSPTATIPTVHFRGRVPLESLLPQTTPDSRIRFLEAEAGMRSANSTQQEVWRLSLFDLMLQRAWWSGAVRMIDVQSGTFHEHDRTWFEIGTGPGFHVQGASSVSGSIQALGGRRSTGIYSSSDRILEGSGWHGGIRLLTSLGLADVAVLSAYAGRTRFTSGPLISNELGASFAVRLTAHLKLNGDLRYTSDEGSTTSAKSSSTLIGIGLGYNLNSTQRN